MSRSRLYLIRDPSHVSSIRREVTGLAQRLGFSETGIGNIQIVATELATNLLKHAGQGALLLRSLETHGPPGLEVLSIDKGRGMANVARCLEDGYSTAGSPGTGLGAVLRQSDLVDLYSVAGQGTVLVAQFWLKKGRPRQPEAQVGAVCTPVAEEADSCGDAWTLRQSPGRTQLLVVDGLGHGPLAARAADQALATFQELNIDSPVELVRGLHGPLRATRGAALALAQIEPGAGVVRFVGVGNISGTIVNGSARRSMISHNGTVGHELHRVAEFTYPWNPEATMILHSDGLSARWNLDTYPGLLSHHPSVIAGVLFRDFERPKDDSTVIVLRFA